MVPETSLDRKTPTAASRVEHCLSANVFRRHHATYLAFSPRKNWEYEGRIVFYGIPSSQAQEICHQIERNGRAPGRRSGLLQGTVG